MLKAKDGGGGGGEENYYGKGLLKALIDPNLNMNFYSN
jgi:hypothetical protein